MKKESVGISTEFIRLDALLKLSGHPDELVFHHRVVRHHHGDEGIFLHHQQVVPLHRHPLLGLGH